jgi:hypothetical protein
MNLSRYLYLTRSDYLLLISPVAPPLTPQKTASMLFFGLIVKAAQDVRSVLTGLPHPIRSRRLPKKLYFID